MKKLVVTVLLVILSGCGRHPGNGSNPAPGSTSAERPAISATNSAVPSAGGAMASQSANAAGATNAADPEFPAIAIQTAFASADDALIRSCARALIAYQIGDYSGAVREFESFANRTDLTFEQKQLVDSALDKARSMAAATPDTSLTPQPSSAAAVPDTGSDAPAPAFPDPALQESIARAQIAIRIGDYPKAVAELTDIADSPRLTADQKATVQRLLAEARQNLPQAPNNAAKQPVKK